MIQDSIKNAMLYESVHPGFRKAFAFLEDAMTNDPEPGRHEIDGDRIYANVMELTTAPADTLKWEAHRSYIDIQFLLSGEEMIGYTSLNDLNDAGSYSEEKDCLLAASAENVTGLKMHRGMFAVLFPNDAHRPGGAASVPSRVKKIVVKVHV